MGFSATVSGGFKVETNVILFGEELPSEVHEEFVRTHGRCEIGVVA